MKLSDKELALLTGAMCNLNDALVALDHLRICHPSVFGLPALGAALVWNKLMEVAWRDVQVGHHRVEAAPRKARQDDAGLFAIVITDEVRRRR